MPPGGGLQELERSGGICSMQANYPLKIDTCIKMLCPFNEFHHHQREE